MRNKKNHSPEEISSLRRDPPFLMGVREAAVVLLRSERSVREDVRLGRLPSVKLGGAIRIRRADLEAALAGLVRNPVIQSRRAMS